VVNSPAKKWFTGNNAETLFERLEAHGKTWKVYSWCWPPGPRERASLEQATLKELFDARTGRARRSRAAAPSLLAILGG